MAKKLEIGIAEEVKDVSLGTGVKIVDTEHLAIVFLKSLAQVRSQKTRSAGDQNPLFRVHWHPPQAKEKMNPTLDAQR